MAQHHVEGWTKALGTLCEALYITYVCLCTCCTAYQQYVQYATLLVLSLSGTSLYIGLYVQQLDKLIVLFYYC